MITSIIYGRLPSTALSLNEMVSYSGTALYTVNFSSVESGVLVPYRSCVTTLRLNPSFAGGHYDH